MLANKAPSSYLPPLKRLTVLSGLQVDSVIQLLQLLYEPAVIGTQKKKEAVDSGYASEISDEEDDSDQETEISVESLRADKFEKSVAVKWLVGFVGRAEEWVEEVSEEDGEHAARSKALEGASALLSAISGLVTGPLMRTFEFPQSDGADPIVIHLRDASIVDTDHTSVGLQTWGSSCILAQRMVKSPSTFGLVAGRRPMRVLELGAGTGLMSMVLTKLLLDDRSEVVATDFHPAVLSNLRSNVDGNFSEDDSLVPTILPLDWRRLHSLATSENGGRLDIPLDTPFDLIIGADIIYEPSHAEWVKSSVELLLRKPNEGQPTAYFYLIMPARPTHEAETASVPATFPVAADTKDGRDGLEVAILTVEEIERIAGTGRTDEVRYYLYRIGWA